MAKRRVFYSFHYKPDNWRVSQVRNIGVVEGNRPATGNEWETVKRGGDQAIRNWINGQLQGKSCLVVLVGANTAGRKWINYEIKQAWETGKGLVGIHINKLKDRNGKTADKGRNPFSDFNLHGMPLTQLAKCHTPSGSSSAAAYNDIVVNLEKWIEDAIASR